MFSYFKRVPEEIKEIIQLAGNIASQEGVGAYLVGGFVRDLLLGVRNLDLDIVADKDGIAFAEKLAVKLKGKLIQHRRFQTATLALGHNLKIDIATARKEIYPHPASLPVVSSGSLKDDLARRDFTINAMALSINAEGPGRLIDFFGGKEDLQKKRVRVLHSLSFIDDPTRILRAVRFEQRYNFKIEPQSLRLLKEAVRKNMLDEVQAHRLRDELILLLKEEESVKGIRRLESLAGWRFVHPRLRLVKENLGLLRQAAVQISWFKRKYPVRRQLDSWLIYFMGLTTHLDTQALETTCDKFAFRRGESSRILSFKKHAAKVAAELSLKKLQPSRIFSLLEPLSYEVILLMKAKYKNRPLQQYCADFFEIYNGIRLFIGGEDLRRLGIAPGPDYKSIFTRVLNAKLEGKVRTKEEELALIKRLMQK